MARCFPWESSTLPACVVRWYPADASQGKVPRVASDASPPKIPALLFGSICHDLPVLAFSQLGSSLHCMINLELWIHFVLRGQYCPRFCSTSIPEGCKAQNPYVYLGCNDKLSSNAAASTMYAHISIVGAYRRSEESRHLRSRSYSGAASLAEQLRYCARAWPWGHTGWHGQKPSITS